LEQKIRKFELEPQSKEEVLSNIRKLRKDLGLEGISHDKEHIMGILKKTGSISDEVLRTREQDRQ
jgi:hypothetical protein